MVLYKRPKQASVSYGLDRASFNQGANAQYNFSVIEEQQPTLTAKGPGAVCTIQIRDDGEEYVVRRLIPDECCRLQGMPDGWCNIGDWIDSNGKKRKDSDTPKYKAFGNGMALPNALYVMEGIVQINDIKEVLE